MSNFGNFILVIVTIFLALMAIYYLIETIATQYKKIKTVNLEEIDENLKTIATFSFPIEADLVKSKLDSEGIRAFIFDVNIVGMNWFYSKAVGGVKLKVREGDVEKALAVLGETLKLPSEVIKDEPSEDIKISRPPQLSFIIILSLILLITILPAYCLIIFLNIADSAGMNLAIFLLLIILFLSLLLIIVFIRG
ncbi:MAG: DUF2007 domain-containing protein, partial [Armatimonadota bacterium]